MRQFLIFIIAFLLFINIKGYAQFKPSEQQYTASDSLSLNGGFEQGKGKWSNLNGSFALSDAEKVVGNKAGCITLSSQVLDFSQTLTAGYPSNIDGLKGYFSAYAKAGFNFEMCGLSNGVEIGCKSINSSLSYDWFKTSADLVSTSVGIKFKTAAAVTGTICIDQAEYGVEKFPTGSDGQILYADSTAPSGYKFDDVPISTTLTTKGDIQGYSTANERIPVGNDDELLFADSTSATGVAWKDPATVVFSVAQSEFIGSIHFSDNNCEFNRSSTSYGVLTSASACSPNILSSNLSFPNSTEMGIQINNAKVGTYRVEFQGLLYNSNNLNSCYFTLSTTANNENQGEIFTGVGNTGNRADNTLIGNFEVTTEGNLPIKIIARNTGGTQCRVYGTTLGESRFNVYYHPPQSQIVRQSQELNAETANTLVAYASATGVVSDENYDWINGNCTAVGGTFDCNLNISLNTKLVCQMDGVGLSDINATYDLANSSTTAIRFRTYTTSASNQQNIIICEKTGADVNKSQIVYGQFEQIKSTELVKFVGNPSGTVNAASGVATTVNLDEIEIDNNNAYDSVNNYYVIPKDSTYQVCVNAGTTGTGTGSFLVYALKNGTTKLTEGRQYLVGGRQAQPSSCKVLQLSQGDNVRLEVFQDMGATAGIYTGEAQTFMTIEETPDIASIVKNLNDNKSYICSLRFLSGNFGTNNGNIADLNFSNLTIGKKYLIKARIRAVLNSQDNYAVEYYPSGDTTTLCYPTGAGQNGTNPTAYDECYFTATTTSIEAYARSLNAGSAIQGTGGLDGTKVELCEVPDNHIEGSF